MATAEETKEIKADAKKRASEQKKAVEAHEDQVAEIRQSEEEAAKGTQAVQPMPVTEAVGEALEEYGPYDDYKLVPTSQGENAVPFRKVLFFNEVEEFSAKMGRMVTTKKPFYRSATKEEMEPILARKVARKKALRGVA